MEHKATQAEYLAFFRNWLHYQFGRSQDRLHNAIVMSEVKKIVSDDDDLQHWANRDNWSMLDFAEQNLKAKAIVAIES
jgi:galactose-1-phosphate uridylyltransferase